MSKSIGQAKARGEDIQPLLDSMTCFKKELEEKNYPKRIPGLIYPWEDPDRFWTRPPARNNFPRGPAPARSISPRGPAPGARGPGARPKSVQDPPGIN